MAHTTIHFDLIIALIVSIFGIVLFFRIIIGFIKDLNKQPFEAFNESEAARDMKIVFKSNKEYFESSWGANENSLIKKIVLHTDRLKESRS